MSVEDVYGILSHAESLHDEVVIIKSKAMKHCMEVDGMSLDEFEEHWGYNIAGSKGKYSYSTVDDLMSSDMIDELLEENEEIINPPLRD